MRPLNYGSTGLISSITVEPNVKIGFKTNLMIKNCRCDRILWHGRGIQQLSYVRKEFKFSDHRPVCATFLVEVEVMFRGQKKKVSTFNIQIDDDFVPTRSSYYS